MKVKKGVSPILATVLLIAITLALGGLLYAYVNGMFNNLAQTVSVNAQAEIIANPSNGESYLQYTLKNDGNIQVTITKIIVENEAMNVNIVLTPGETYQNVTSLNGNYQAGVYYTVIFQGQSATGKPVSIALDVLANPYG